MNNHQHLLCNQNDIGVGESKGFSVKGTEIFVVRRETGFYAYQNRCPHVGATLEFMPDRFIDATGHYILCAMHGALFECDTGYCISGPCTGQSLTALNIRLENDQLYVRL
jgi:nitrite reductase/ring-hydroxylating ferredoxin subunit